jgi:hypothetical protein
MNTFTPTPPHQPCATKPYLMLINGASLRRIDAANDDAARKECERLAKDQGFTNAMLVQIVDHLTVKAQWDSQRERTAT